MYVQRAKIEEISACSGDKLAAHMCSKAAKQLTEQAHMLNKQYLFLKVTALLSKVGDLPNHHNRHQHQQPIPGHNRSRCSNTHAIRSCCKIKDELDHLAGNNGSQQSTDLKPRGLITLHRPTFRFTGQVGDDMIQLSRFSQRTAWQILHSLARNNTQMNFKSCIPL